MGVPALEVGYTSATTGRGDHEVHKGHVVALEKKSQQPGSPSQSTITATTTTWKPIPIHYYSHHYNLQTAAD
jgi:hypothetical protein